jgi:hypothetical protein
MSRKTSIAPASASCSGSRALRIVTARGRWYHFPASRVVHACDAAAALPGRGIPAMKGVSS